MKPVRQLALAARRRAATLRRSIRRRPRSIAAASLVIALAVLLASGLVVQVSSTPPAAAGTVPSFTVRSGWTLAELEHHLAAGEIDAISAAPATTANPAGALLARLRRAEGRLGGGELEADRH